MRAHDPEGNIVQRRPAEVLTAAGGAAVVIAYFLGIDDTPVILGLAAVLAGVPAAITFLVGLRK
jgi:hypothetical protein